MLIIGMLTGGVLKGRSLLEGARIRSVITEVENIQLAVVAFLDRYHALPGDFRDASDQLGVSGYDGNENGIIEGKGLEPGSEAVGFWQHLKAAQLIANPGIPLRDRVHFGAGAPQSSLGGGFTVETFLEETRGVPSGTWLILGSASNQRGLGGLLTPAQAHVIDQKLDDGSPISGFVYSTEGDGVDRGKCIKNGKYNLMNKEPSCVLYIAIQQ